MTAAVGSMITLVTHYSRGLHAWQLAPSLAIAGISFGIVSGALADLVLRHVPARLSADASGVVNTVTEFGSVLAIAVAGGIYFAVLGPRPSTHAFTHAASAALWYLAICCAAPCAGAAFLPSRRPRPADHGSAASRRHRELDCGGSPPPDIPGGVPGDR